MPSCADFVVILVKRAGFDVDCEVKESESLLVGCLPAFEQEGDFYTLISVRKLGVEVELTKNY